MARFSPSARVAVLVGMAAILFKALIATAADETGRAKGPAYMVVMPGKSFAGPLPPLDKEQAAIRDGLKADVEMLAGKIGERNVSYQHARLEMARVYLDGQFKAAGYDKVDVQTFTAKGRACHNLEVTIEGGERAKEIVVVGAHYDSAIGAPGANDNGSGMAGVLALARHFHGKKHKRTIRFVAFTNEEQPNFQTEQMGSLVYARRCKARGDVIPAMLSLETIGYYSDVKGSQRYPALLSRFFPAEGNFIGFVGDANAAPLVTEAVATFREHAKFPSEGAALFGSLPGVGWSDHWSFWQVGYPAIMVTDTALFRYPHYHKTSDTPDKIDYDRTARVVAGLQHVISRLAGPVEK